ncbi:CBS domain-containing protein [Heliobacterium gestii]|uniref:CBS domain-containing protein n=1 Tax=Heliomicrobium gestii TaxID=2699 RepID=A0A845LP66_HELGE|nr:CBS domain-containing protein [Heliomicrobium gestii]MBM7868522.1 CBS domain-containing protein/sporulation protein YlmC with PRC-barrel domain [Heliomicrobium gestii]MZP44676.1 CBS domain-containing protein [Heliomicrobium gestii]
MSAITVLGEFYFSQVLGKPIYDIRGKRVGRVRDLTIQWNGQLPQVTGIKFNKESQVLIPTTLLSQWDAKGLYLTCECTAAVTVQLRPDEIYIGKWLLDKQIIDLKGSRLVRVNDITLSWVSRGTEKRILLMAVDIGFRGLMRRLGMERIVQNVDNRLLGWQYINPLENRNSSLHLNQEKQLLSQLHPADIADILEELDYHKRAHLMGRLDSEQAVEALREMELDTQVEIINRMDAQQASDILEEMAPDDAADILAELPEEKSRGLLDLMETEGAQDVQELMEYAEGTAGSLMTTEYIELPLSITADEAIRRLRELARTAETIYYLYVTDEQEILQGVFSLRELILAEPSSILCDVMNRGVVAVNHDDDRVTVAETINKYGLLALPVVDESRKMLGIITVDDVLDELMAERGRASLFSLFTVRRRSERRMESWKQ